MPVHDGVDNGICEVLWVKEAVVVGAVAVAVAVAGEVAALEGDADVVAHVVAAAQVDVHAAYDFPESGDIN